MAQALIFPSAAVCYHRELYSLLKSAESTPLWPPLLYCQESSHVRFDETTAGRLRARRLGRRGVSAAASGRGTAADGQGLDTEESLRRYGFHLREVSKEIRIDFTHQA